MALPLLPCANPCLRFWFWYVEFAHNPLFTFMKGWNFYCVYCVCTLFSIMFQPVGWKMELWIVSDIAQGCDKIWQQTSRWQQQQPSLDNKQKRHLSIGTAPPFHQRTFSNVYRQPGPLSISENAIEGCHGQSSGRQWGVVMPDESSLSSSLLVACSNFFVDSASRFCKNSLFMATAFV